jgi:NAD(P)-dependent dehydrogenase (short-subunit alcohol dehydrogenase family)
MRKVILASFLAFAAAGAQAADAPASVAASSGQKAVLVTGASTGIGRRITERLAADGHFVYAGARKQADLDALNQIKNVQAIKLDVSSAADMAAAIDLITKAGRGLYGLVNNAGVAVMGPLAETREEDFDFVMQVNVYGPYRVTKAFAPLIVASRGRITTISSISGILSGRNFGVYSMSKHAVEAFGDSLAAEMQPQGVAVSLIEPGNYKSEIGASAAKRMGVETRLSDRSRFKEPDEVADAVKLALFEAQPRRRYMVVPNEQEAQVTIRKAIEELAQLNEGHAYTYDRAALVAMLDEALTQSRPRVVTDTKATLGASAP